MQKGVLENADKYSKAHKRRSRWYRVVVFLAAAVVFCTTYALILPAITLEEGQNELIIPSDSSPIESTAPLETDTAEPPGIEDQKPPPLTDDSTDSDETSSVDTTVVPSDSTDSDDTSTDETTGIPSDSTDSVESSTDETTGIPSDSTDSVESSTDETTGVPSDSTDSVESSTAETTGIPSNSTDSDEASTAETTGTPSDSSTSTETNASIDTSELESDIVSDPNSDSEDPTEDSDKAEPTHKHSDSCFKDGELICGLDEEKSEDTSENQLEKLLEVLPTKESISEQLAGYYSAGDNEGLIGYLDELSSIISFVRTSCDELSKQLDRLETEPSFEEKLTDLEAFIKGLAENRFPRLDGDKAYISSLTPTSSRVESEYERFFEHQVRKGDTITFDYSLTADTYNGESFENARIDLEFVLPFGSSLAEFADTVGLDDAFVTTEQRSIDGIETECQVLYGYATIKLPGSLDGSISVTVGDIPPDSTLSLMLSASTEFSSRDEICELHGQSEYLTAQTNGYLVSATYTAEEQSEFFAELKALIEETKENGELEAESELFESKLLEAFRKNKLSKELFDELSALLEELSEIDLSTIAEPSHGSNWKLLRDSGWFEEYSAYADYSFDDIWDFGYLDVEAASTPAEEAQESSKPSDVQVDDRGGSNFQDDVTVSKTIKGTELENVFDITLTVETKQKIEEVISEPDMAVVIVMDISNTMTDNFGNSTRYKAAMDAAEDFLDITRYQAAMDAAEDFLDKFAESNTLGVSKIGYVAFNTDAHEIFGLTSCTNQNKANALKNTMRTATGKIINASGYGESHKRFTNVEAGLKMASDMLDGVSNKNKFIIFLSDGFPTTYIESGYNGYDTYDSTGRFYDHHIGVPCLYGTSYSDEAAIRARDMATLIKNSGTTIFSIGVDVGGQTIAEYDTHDKDDGFSVIDRTGTTYEIGGASDESAYKNWLGNSIGSGYEKYYYDSENTAELNAAYNQIFAEIKTTVENASKADWVAEDPMPIVNEVENIEFIGFYNSTPELVSTDLLGSHAEGAENTASFAGNTIKWDLKQSGYTSSGSANNTTFSYRLVYRVRLKNENSEFVENQIYDTNGETTLQYKTVKNNVVSDPKTIDFPIPSVHGFLAELEFVKVDTAGNHLSDAEFKLEHSADCSICHGDGNSVAIAEQTAVSASDGRVVFANIPSGHTYTLTETKAPNGYILNDTPYTVKVAYDTITVNDGDWNLEFVNRIYYELPQTGGSGTVGYTVGGITLVSCSLLLLAYTNHRRKKDGR